MPASELAPGPLDRAGERAARWLGGRSTRRSVLGRVGESALARLSPRPAPCPPASTSDVAVATVSGSADVKAEPVADAVAAVAAVADVTAPVAKPVDTAGLVPVFDQDVSPPAPTLPTPPPAVASVPTPPKPLPPAPSVWTPPTLTPPTRPPLVEPSVAPPRATTVRVPRDPVAAAVAISASRFERTEHVVLAPADAVLLAVAMPVAAVLDAPLLVASAHGVPEPTGAEIARLGRPRVHAVGLDVPGAERIDPEGADAGAASLAAAAFVRARAGTARAFALADGAEALAGAVAAAAALRRFPVMVGPEAARAGALEGERRAAVTYLVGRQAIEAAARVPGGFPLPTSSDADVPARLLQLLRADGVQPAAYGIAPTGTDAVLAAVLAACGGPLLAAPPAPPGAPGGTPAPTAPLQPTTTAGGPAAATPTTEGAPAPAAATQPTMYVLAD